jgi:hypothetical protein
MIAQLNTFLCHRWGISGRDPRVSHYGMQLDDRAE